MTGLSSAKRMSLVQDESALANAGTEKIGSLLDLITALSSDQEHSIVESYAPALGMINDYLLTSVDREAYHAWIRNTFRPMLAKVKRMPAPGESDDTRALRASLIKVLGLLGEDPDTDKEATSL